VPDLLAVLGDFADLACRMPLADMYRMTSFAWAQRHARRSRRSSSPAFADAALQLVCTMCSLRPAVGR
jgi:hypothetical protein